MKYLCVLALLLCSCYGDKGNYDYNNLNEITIEGFNEMDKIEKYAFSEELEINPIIKGTISNEDSSNLEFEWKLIPTGESGKDLTKDYVIGREKNLKYLIVQAPGDYYGVLYVTDKSSGNVFSKRFFVNVKHEISNGWAFLCEDKEGKARLDWVYNKTETEDKLLRDIWGDHPDFQEAVGKPLSIDFFFTFGAGNSYRVIDGENGSFNCNEKTMMLGDATNMRYLFGTLPDNVYIKGGAPGLEYQDRNINILIDKSGDVYSKITSAGNVFSYPINMLSATGEKFKVAPYVAIQTWKGWDKTKGSVMFYDQDNCRFVEFRNGSSYLSVAKFTGSLFEPTAGREMVYMETTRVGKSYALLKDKSNGKYYVYGFNLGNNGANIQTFYNEVKGAELENLKCVVFDKLNEYMFYSAGGNVYRFNLVSKGEEKEAQKVITLPNEDIVKLFYPKFIAWKAYKPWELERENRLTVASNKGGVDVESCGQMRTYKVPMASGDLVIVKEHIDLGICKIIDMTYFE